MKSYNSNHRRRFACILSMFCLSLSGCFFAGKYGLPACVPNGMYTESCYIAVGDKVKLYPVELDGAEYERWRHAGFTQNEVLPWLRALHKSADALLPVSPNSFDARDYAVKYQWNETVDPSEALDWRNSGFDPTDAGEWVQQFRGLSPQDARQLADAGYRPTHTVACEAPALAPSRLPSHGATCGLGDDEIPDALNWTRSNFTAAQRWACKVADVQLSDAVLWKDHGFNCSETREWRAHGVDNAVTASDWTKEGIDAAQVPNVSMLQQRGYSKSQAIDYAKRNMGPKQARSEEKFNATVSRFCQGKVQNLSMFAATSSFGNPYTAKGRCYIVQGFVAQWLGPSDALMSVLPGGVGTLFRAEFSKPPENPGGRMLIRDEGVFVYTAVSGAMMTIPRVRVLTVDIPQ